MGKRMETIDNTPSNIIANTTVEWSMSPSYKPADGFTIECHLAGASALIITGTSVDGDTVSFKINPADTATWAAGIAFYQYVAIKGSDKYVFIDAGQLEVKKLITSAPVDNRSLAKRIVDAIDAVMEGKATADQAAYQIGNRQLTRIPLPDLMRVREYYARIVAAEDRNRQITKGNSPFGLIKLRLARS
jgi:hypothetical protein